MTGVGRTACAIGVAHDVRRLIAGLRHLNAFRAEGPLAASGRRVEDAIWRGRRVTFERGHLLIERRHFTVHGGGDVINLDYAGRHVLSVGWRRFQSLILIKGGAVGRA